MIVCPAGPVTALAVSADGSRLASGHADGTLAVWDRATGKQLGAVEGARGGGATRRVRASAAHCSSPPGSCRTTRPRCSAGASRRTARPLPAAGDLRTLGKDVYCFAVAPDGQSVYAGGHNGLLLKRRFAEPAAIVARSRRPPSAAIVAHRGFGRRQARHHRRRARDPACWTADLKPDDSATTSSSEEVTALAAQRRGAPRDRIRRRQRVAGRHRSATRSSTPRAGGSTGSLRPRPGKSHSTVRPAGSLGGAGHDLATGDTRRRAAGVVFARRKTLFTGSRRRRDSLVGRGPRRARPRGDIDADWSLAVAVSPDGGRFVVADRHHVSRYEGKSEGPRATAPAAGSPFGFWTTGSCAGLRSTAAPWSCRATGNTALERFRATCPTVALRRPRRSARTAAASRSATTRAV